MKIDGKTRICGLIGNPVEHTISPALHNTMAEKMGINLVYVPLFVKENLKDAVKGAYALNFLGMNVTVPYKSEVMELLTECDGLAEKIGAVNTLVRTAEGYKGYNTDMTGLYRAMTSDGIVFEGEEIIILGAGGAARAVAYMCVHYGAEKAYILNRSVEKAENIAKEIKASMGRDCIVPMSLTEYDRLPNKKMLCIQATSVGLSPDSDKAVIMEKEFYQKIHTGYDLIYRPVNTKFMQLVKEQGGQAYSGLKMLLYQGIESFELWNQTKVSVELCEKLYTVMKGELGIEK